MNDLTCCGTTTAAIDQHRIEQLCRRYARSEPDFAAWAAGYGVITHTPLTQLRVRAMLDYMRSPEAAEAKLRQGMEPA